VALLASARRQTGDELARHRINTLRRRIVELEEGDITPRQIKDEVLWMCPDCQRVMLGLPALDRTEIERRLEEQARRLERALANAARRAG
jgi:ribosomal protein L34E